MKNNINREKSITSKSIVNNDNNNNFISSNGNVCDDRAIFISDDLVSVLHAISLIQHHVILLLQHCAITPFSYFTMRCICSLFLKIHRSDEDGKRILILGMISGRKMEMEEEGYWKDTGNNSKVDPQISTELY